MRVLLGLLLCAVVLGAAEPRGDEPAGNPELRRLDRRIGAARAALAEAERALDQNHLHGLDLLEVQAVAMVPTIDKRAPPENPRDPQAYLRLLHDATGFHPLKPIPRWQRSWVTHRRAEHRLHERRMALYVALQRMIELRRRLRAQLGLPPLPAGS